MVGRVDGSSVLLGGKPRTICGGMADMAAGALNEVGSGCGGRGRKGQR